MKYRKLRIAWSVGFIAVALVIIGCRAKQKWWPTEQVRRLRASGLFMTDDSDRNWVVEAVTEPILNMTTTVRKRRPLPGRVIRQPWFLPFAVAAIAPLPWISPRFSLRTLLIAAALVAVVLGLIVWAVRG